jgi:hypothetical protein
MEKSTFSGRRPAWYDLGTSPAYLSILISSLILSRAARTSSPWKYQCSR